MAIFNDTYRIGQNLINQYVYKDFKEFWEMVSRQNPEKVGKMGMMTFEELKTFCQNAFYAARRLKTKKPVTYRQKVQFKQNNKS